MSTIRKTICLLIVSKIQNVTFINIDKKNFGLLLYHLNIQAP